MPNPDEIKNWMNVFEHWVKFLGFPTVGALALAIKKVRDWVLQKVKWLYSKWPYEIIRKQRVEIEKLKGKQLSEDEVLILQCLWAFGVESTIDQETVMKIINCKSQKASYLLHKLGEDRKIYSKGGYGEEQFVLSTDGQKYIVNNRLEVTKEQFLQMLRDRNVKIKDEKS